MYTDVKIIMQTLKKDAFSGHVKIGIEHGMVVSLTRNFNDAVKAVKSKFNDYERELKALDSWLKFGNLEFDLANGDILGMNASDYLCGDDLKSWVDANKCRFVKVVVKK